MPPTQPEKKAEWAMPTPPPIVAWTNAPGGAVSYAAVTSAGKHAIGVMIFPPESRVGTPKEGVRHISDPRNLKSGIDPDSGVWDYTAESKQLQNLEGLVAGVVADSLTKKTK